MPSGRYPFNAAVAGRVNADSILQGVAHLFITTLAQTFTGNKTFSNNVAVNGELSVEASGAESELHLVSNATDSNDSTIYFDRSSGDTGPYVLRYDYSADEIILGQLEADGDIHGLTVNGNGHVSIGNPTASPGQSAELLVYGQAASGGGNAYLELSRNSLSGTECMIRWSAENGTPNFEFGMTENSSPFNSLSLVSDTGGELIYWRDNASNKATYIPSGEVQLINGTTNEITFNSAQDTSQFHITNSISGDTLNIGPSSTTGLSIDNAANVTASADLTVDGEAKFTGGFSIKVGSLSGTKVDDTNRFINYTTSPLGGKFTISSTKTTTGTIEITGLSDINKTSNALCLLYFQDATLGLGSLVGTTALTLTVTTAPTADTIVTWLVIPDESSELVAPSSS